MRSSGRRLGRLGPLLAVLMLASSEARAEDEPPAPKEELPEPEGASSPPTPTPATPSVSAAPTAEAKPASVRSVDVRGTFELGVYQDSAAVSVLTPTVALRADNPTAGWSIDGRYLVDMVSAASPDIVATASPRWTETRHAGSAGGRYKPNNFGVALNANTSYTPDYLSLGANASVIQDLDDKNLTLTAGYGFGHDVIGRTGTSFDLFSRKLDYHSITLGASRVVNQAVVVGLFSDVIVERGDQSKPYRYIPIFSSADAAQVVRGASVDSVSRMRIQARPLEQLPLARERAALTARLAWRLSHSTVRVDERFYADTWGLRASTTEARWLFDVGERLILWPHLRVHLQNGVDFWQRAYVGSAADLPQLRTGDRELGPLSNLGLGGGARLALGRAASREDWVLVGLVDGTWTSFHDAIYIKDRLSALAVLGLEVGF